MKTLYKILFLSLISISSIFADTSDDDTRSKSRNQNQEETIKK
jgi:hypothetical protein